MRPISNEELHFEHVALGIHRCWSQIVMCLLVLLMMAMALLIADYMAMIHAGAGLSKHFFGVMWIGVAVCFIWIGVNVNHLIKLYHAEQEVTK